MPVAASKKVFTAFLDLLWPPHCALCGARTDADPICRECESEIPPIGGKFCPGCGNPVIDEYCPEHPDEPYPYFMPAFLFGEGIRELIHMLKYSGRQDIGLHLGRRLGELFGEHFRDIDGILPVPLHPARKRERGYNQSAVIAAGLAEVLDLEIFDSLIRRRKNTKSQTRLDAAQRRDNISGAFEPARDISGVRLALLNDVITTGATSREVAKCVREVGGIVDFAVCIARPSRDESREYDI